MKFIKIIIIQQKNINKAIKLHNPGAGPWYKDKVLSCYKEMQDIYKFKKLKNMENRLANTSDKK